KKEYGHDPTLYSFYGWDALNVYVETAKRACTATDREKFRQALNTIDNVPTLSGKATFKNPPDGENLSAAVIVNQTTGRSPCDAAKSPDRGRPRARSWTPTGGARKGHFRGTPPPNFTLPP